MDIGVKETRCTNCSHLKVCKLKEDFLAAQSAVDTATIYTDGIDGTTNMRKVANMDWIKPVMLDCIHFEPYDIRLKGENLR